MDPEGIARLITEDPSIISESLYHLTTRDKTEDIKRKGLRWDVSRRYENAGSGIYLFSGFDNWVPIAEYLGDIQPVDIAVIEVDVDIDDPAMLMDEDSMSFIGERMLTRNFEVNYEELATKLEALLKRTPDNQLEQVKQKFIENHNLKPDTVDIFRYQIVTGRYTRRISASQIENIYYPSQPEESQKDLEPEEIAKMITTDPDIQR